MVPVFFFHAPIIHRSSGAKEFGICLILAYAMSSGFMPSCPFTSRFKFPFYATASASVSVRWMENLLLRNSSLGLHLYTYCLLGADSWVV